MRHCCPRAQLAPRAHARRAPYARDSRQPVTSNTFQTPIWARFGGHKPLCHPGSRQVALAAVGWSRSPSVLPRRALLNRGRARGKNRARARFVSEGSRYGRSGMGVRPSGHPENPDGTRTTALKLLRSAQLLAFVDHVGEALPKMNETCERTSQLDDDPAVCA